MVYSHQLSDGAMERRVQDTFHAVVPRRHRRIWHHQPSVVMSLPVIIVPRPSTGFDMRCIGNRRRRQSASAEETEFRLSGPRRLLSRQISSTQIPMDGMSGNTSLLSTDTPFCGIVNTLSISTSNGRNSPNAIANAVPHVGLN